MFNAGWANNCGIELFSLGWITCEQALETLTQGGKQFKNNYLVFQPVLKPITESILVSESTIDQLNGVVDLDQYQFDVGDDSYGLSLDQPAASVLNGLEPQAVEDMINQAVSRVSVPKERVRQTLVDEIERAMQQARKVKALLFRDDRDLIDIIIMTDEL